MPGTDSRLGTGRPCPTCGADMTECDHFDRLPLPDRLGRLIAAMTDEELAAEVRAMRDFLGHLSAEEGS